MRGWDERNKSAAPWRVRCGNVDANQGPFLDGNRRDACEFGDQVAEMWLVPDKEEGVSATSSEELGNMSRSRAIGKMLVDRGGRLQRCGNHGAGLGAATGG